MVQSGSNGSKCGQILVLNQLIRNSSFVSYIISYHLIVLDSPVASIINQFIPVKLDYVFFEVRKSMRWNRQYVSYSFESHTPRMGSILYNSSDNTYN